MSIYFGVANYDLRGYTNPRKVKKHWIYIEWYSMLQRCYSEKFQEKNPTYIGCTVCDRWLIFSNFVADAESLPGFDKVIENNFSGVSLDKDYLVCGNKIYSPDTCQWTTISENSHERNNRLGSPLLSDEIRDKAVRNGHNPQANKARGIAQGHPVVVIFPDGNVEEYYGVAEASRVTGVTRQTITYCCNGGHKTVHKNLLGWSFYWKEDYNFSLCSI